MATNSGEGSKQFYRFGPFRVDPEKELLLRDDEAVPLAPKAFQVLLVLVRHSKQVVTKDDLLKAVWPDTFVEEANLSRNVFLLRKALGEEPQDHQYIVTVPGHGYRFAEDVRLMPGPELDIVSASHSKVEVQIGETHPWRWIAVVGVLVAAGFLGALKLFAHRAPVLTEKDTVVLADFANSTGDPVFDGTLQQGLEIQLQQSPYLSLVPSERVRQTLRMMGDPADAGLTPTIAREVCERTASSAVLNGSIAKLGSQYVLGLRAEDCRTGRVLADEQAQAAHKEDVLNALSVIATNFRSRIGESLMTVQKYATPLDQATTPSLEALKAYSTGWKFDDLGQEEAAEPFFEKAIQIDPNFAMAYASLALEYGSAGESGLATQDISKAWQLRDRVSDNERFFITAYYEGRATGNQEKAQAICEEWAQAYPRDLIPHAMLAGFIYPAFGNFKKMEEQAEIAVRLRPDAEIGYQELVDAYLDQGRISDAEKALQTASDRNIDAPFVSLLRYDIAFLKDDNAGMEREFALSRGKSETRDWVFDHAAFVMAYSGHMRAADSMSQSAVGFAKEGGHPEKAAMFEARVALRQAFAGNTAAAKRSAAEALALATNREVQYGAAFALALAGDSSRAEALANDMEKNFPEDTAIRFSYLPSIRAVLALDRGDSARALELLQAAAPNELGQPRSAINGYFGALYPVYVRGLAYMKSGQGDKAAGEFQKILDHRAAVISDPVSIVAQLQLARAYALSGDLPKAEMAYRSFLTLWKNADPDIPDFKEAKAEYAKLK